MSSWSCPHDVNGVCQLVQGATCEPGMRRCVLEGKVRFGRDETNLPRKPVKPAAPPEPEAPAPPRRKPLHF